MNNNKPNCNGCRALMQRIRALDFSIQETALYLDTHPGCLMAMEHYHSLIAQREAAMAEHEQKCGPITMFGNKNRSTWQWINSPWPWEYEAN